MPGEGWRAGPVRLWCAAREGVRTQVVATLGLAPLSLVFFQQISLVGFAANLVAIPLVMFMPDTWLTRMASIGSYEVDRSAMGRISAWWTCTLKPRLPFRLEVEADPVMLLLLQAD